MSRKLYEIMSDNRANLEDEVFLRMSVAESLHNHTLDEELLRGRITRMVVSFLTSILEGPEEFVSYIEDITEARIDEGIMLHEQQLALQVLEEKAWGFIVESIPLDDQVKCLSQITLTIGTAKDRIAHIYLHHLEMVEETVALMHSGSRSAVGDDLNWQRGHVSPHQKTV